MASPSPSPSPSPSRLTRPPVPMKLHISNRQKLLSSLRRHLSDSSLPLHGFVFLQGGEEQTRYDTDHIELFRQESYFAYLFGVVEPGFYGAIDIASGKSILFAPRLPADYAVWLGEIKPLTYFKEKYKVSMVFYTDEIAEVLQNEYQESNKSLLFLLHGLNTDSDNYSKPAEFQGIDKFETDLTTLHPILTECRVIKSDLELALIQFANDISSEAHVEVMRKVRAGMKEYQLESLFLHHTYMYGGCRHCSYTCICATGGNSSVLHYGHAAAPNDRTLQDGDMALLDMGAEYNFYGSDITCSFPVNGKFTSDQSLIYNAVLDAHNAVIAAMKPGVRWTDMHKLAEKIILESLRRGGILVGNVDDMMVERAGAVFMPHGLGHFLGIDTHDPGGYSKGMERPKEPGLKSLRTIRELQEGMVITVEPGCYFIDALLVPAMENSNTARFFNREAIRRFQGFGGVRIESDVSAMSEIAETNNPPQSDGGMTKSPTSSHFNQAEIEKIRSLLGLLEQPSSSCSFSGKSLSHGLHASDRFIQDSWIIDSGATDHMTASSAHFTTYSPCPSNKKIVVADGSVTTVAGVGHIQLSPSLLLKDVLHVPKLSTSLLSIHKLTRDMNCNVLFYPSHCVFQDQVSGKRIGHAKEKGGLYYLDVSATHSPIVKHVFSESCFSVSNNDDIWRHHFRFGHPSFTILKTMFPSLFKNVHVEDFHCDICEFAKHKRVSFPISSNRSSFPFYLIHTDIWGPSRIPNVTGARWFVSFIDDCTRVSWIFLLKHKSDVTTILPNFIAMIHNQFGVKVKRFRSDNAKDYFNQFLSPYFLKEGIVHESSCIDTPQQNGVAERKNGHLLATTRALLFQNRVPKTYWGEAVLTAAHIINRLPSKALGNQTPMQLLHKFYSNIRPTNNLTPRVFGCPAFVHVSSHNRGKLDPRAIKCVFVGYSPTQKGYKCYHPPTRKFYISVDVTFEEGQSFFSQPYLQGESSFIGEDKAEDLPFLDLPISQPYSSQEPSLQPELSPQEPNHETVEPVPISDRLDTRRYVQVYSRRRDPEPDPEQVQNSTPTPENEVCPNPISSPIPSDYDLPIALRKGTRECTKHPRYPLAKSVSFHRFSPSHRSFLANLNSIPIPNTLSEALSDEKWREAMRVEMEALEKNRTWDIVELPQNKRAVGCKWVFAVKYRSDGSLERYKARLVAKGYTQTYGVDYQETFAPVAKMNTVRVLLSLAANFNWDLQQFDVKNAFLHGDLEEEIYMEIPPGFGGEIKGNKVCKLKKALYGLKQSPRAWFGRFTKVMLNTGYKQSQGDHTLFIKHTVSGGVTALLVYVDDIIVTGNDEKEKEALKNHLAKEFDIKDLGRLKYFLGIEVARSRQGIFISQQKYVVDLLKETGKLGCKPASTPIDPNHKLGEANDDKAVDKEGFQKLVGKLIYLAHTRPDIAYAVSVVSQFMHNPKEVHLQAANRILHYLKANPGKGILFKKGEGLILEAYTDADYAGSPVDRRSTTGYCTFLGGNLVTWRSKKQNVVARSSAEAEFRAMAQGVCELLWLKIILEDLKIKWEEPMRLYCDNKSAINIAHNPVQHDRTKHIEVDRHFIKEKLDNKLICTPYVPTKEQLADVFTKGLNGHNFSTIISKLGMDNIYSPA